MVNSTAIRQFKEKKVLVIGDTIVDGYFKGNSSRISREAPVPIIDIHHKITSPGGAANTAVNVAALGAKTYFFSVCGEDEAGVIVSNALQGSSVDTRGLLRDQTRATLTKTRIINSDEQVLRYDIGTTTKLSNTTERKLIAILKHTYPLIDAVIISDYGYGIITPKVIQTIAELQKKFQKIVVADAKDVGQLNTIGLTAVKPNYAEALSLLNLPPREHHDRVIQMVRHGHHILEIANTQIAAITIDTHGGLIFERDKPVYYTHTKPSDHSHAVGAGDTFISALTLSLVCGMSTQESSDLAAAAAEIVLSKEGTAVCTLKELLTYSTPSKSEDAKTDLDGFVWGMLKQSLVGDKLVWKKY